MGGEDRLDYDLDALKEGLGKIDKNIAVFEKAIEDERATKTKYRHMIEVLEEKQAAKRRQANVAAVASGIIDGGKNGARGESNDS